MWRKKTARFLILALASVLLAPGCATLTRKSTQRIPVTSSPVGAAVIVNSVKKGVTPLKKNDCRACVELSAENGLNLHKSAESHFCRGARATR